MPADRLKQLEQFYQEDPRDPFNLYALALEYFKSDSSKTRELFDVLLEEHPDYLPTYYHAGKLYEDLGDTATASQIFEKGIELATKKNDAKALRELRSAHDEMMM